MPAPTKRRRLSRYLALPIIVAVAFLTVAKLVAMQRADVIADLAGRVAHGDTADASAAIRQLAAMSRPPVAILVEAATSGDRQVADEARQEISKLLRRCERQIATGQRVKAAGRHLAELAECLAIHSEQFSAGDREWLAATTQHILNLANQIPAKHSPPVAIHCDTILAVLEDTTPSDTKLVKHAPSGESQPSGVERAVAPSAKHPAEESVDASWRADWANPVFRTLPPTPIDSAPMDRPQNNHASSLRLEDRPPQKLQAIDSPLASVDSCTLLQRWLTADTANKTALQLQLAKRGFGRLTEPFVRRFSSSRAEDRLQFVDELLKTPGVDARPWLMMLAEDRDADVRLEAVTIMATSNDAALVEKAWQAAIHDRDPRIAGLAERLRERRAATQRR